MQGVDNLHQGAVGVGVSIMTGRSVNAVQFDKQVPIHPDTGADLFEFWAQRTSLRASVLTGADLSGGLLDRVDLSDADLTDTNRERLELTEVVCPSGVATVGNVGSCDVGGNFDLSAGSTEG